MEASRADLQIRDRCGRSTDPLKTVFRLLMMPMVVLLGACSSAGQQAQTNLATPAWDPTSRFGLSTVSKPAVLPVPVTDRLGLTPEYRGRVIDFLHFFADRQTDEILKVHRPVSGAQPSGVNQAVRDIQRIAERIGISAGRLAVASYQPAFPNYTPVFISFNRSVVQVPDCKSVRPDYSDISSGLGSLSTGCAFQRNLGLSIANPSDLDPGIRFPANGSSARAIGRVEAYESKKASTEASSKSL